MAKARGNKLVPPANFSRNPMAVDARMLQVSPPNREWITDRRPTPSIGSLMSQMPRRGNNVYTPPVPMPEWGGQESSGNPIQDWIDSEQGRGVQNMPYSPSPFLSNPSGAVQNTGGPRSFNPQNQDVLGRAAAALEAIKQDRLAPQFGGSQGYAVPGQNAGIQGSPMLNSIVNSIGRGVQGFAPVARNAFNAYNSTSRQSPMFGGSQGYAVPGQNAFNGPRTPTIQNPINTELAPARDPQAAAMDALRARIDAMTHQSQQANPMAPPTPAYNPMQAEIDRGTRQGNIMFEPGAGSSAGATRNFRKIQPEDLNGMTAGTVNGYNGNTEYARNPMRNSAERKIASSQANAQRLAGGGAAADPTNIGGRFGGAYGANLDADATAIAEGRAVRTADGNVVYHTGTQESAREAYMSARANGYGRTPEQEAARHAEAVKQAQARANKHQAFKDANGGMNYRQYDRMQSSNALTMKAVDEGRLSPEAAMHRMQTRADKALRRAGNPMAMGVANGGRLFPDLMAKRGGQAATPNQNPMVAVQNALRPGGVVTPDSVAAGKDMYAKVVGGSTSKDGKAVPASPLFAGMGLTGEEDNIQDLHFGLQAAVQALPEGADLSDDDLQQLYAGVAGMQVGHSSPNHDPFDMRQGLEMEGLGGPFGLEVSGLFGDTGVDPAHTEVFGPMYKELASMQNPSPQSLRSWWKTFRSRIRPDTNRLIGGSSVLSGEGKPTVSPGGYEYPLPQNPMR